MKMQINYTVRLVNFRGGEKTVTVKALSAVDAGHVAAGENPGWSAYDVWG